MSSQPKYWVVETERLDEQWPKGQVVRWDDLPADRRDSWARLEVIRPATPEERSAQENADAEAEKKAAAERAAAEKAEQEAARAAAEQADGDQAGAGEADSDAPARKRR